VFVDRKQELARLDAIVHAPNAQLVALYGRRRIGKTTLLSHWLDHHDKQALGSHETCVGTAHPAAGPDAVARIAWGNLSGRIV
jgi:hypothetical protein